MRQAVNAVLRRDLRIETRTPQVVPGMALFSISAFVVFHFALQQRSVSGNLAAGVLWVTLLLAAVLGIARQFVADREEGGFEGFLLAPVDRTALLVAKATSWGRSSAPSRCSPVRVTCSCRCWCCRC
jgi:heme exporter protein B